VFLANGSVTAGNASPLTDGASAMLLASEAFVKRHDLTPLAQIKSFAIAGCAPEVMGIGPVESTRKALFRAGLKGADLDVIEMNEAFAAQVLACCADLDVDPAKLNRDGGAIALGHPLGGTGIRLVGKAAQLLKRDGGRYGLATQCIGGGQGISLVVEAI
jgi:acetyl-CoA acyltransferase